MARPLGTPTWLDFSTTDLARSKDFYTGLFGWTFEDSGEAMGHYQMVRNGSDFVAGGMDVSGMTDAEGRPLRSAWTVFLAVDDVDARTKLAVENGATVTVPPGDAGGAGRFSTVIDPTGAEIAFWQAGDMEGYEFTGKPGSPVWFELMTQDYHRAIDFYTKVVDFQEVPMGGDPDFGYATNGPEATASFGICDARNFVPAEMGSFWRIYFNSDDCAAAVERVQELGGSLLDGPADSPYGPVATVADPLGAHFQLGATSQMPDEGASDAR